MFVYKINYEGYYGVWETCYVCASCKAVALRTADIRKNDKYFIKRLPFVYTGLDTEPKILFNM